MAFSDIFFGNSGPPATVDHSPPPPWGGGWTRGGVPGDLYLYDPTPIHTAVARIAQNCVAVGAPPSPRGLVGCYLAAGLYGNSKRSRRKGGGGTPNTFLAPSLSPSHLFPSIPPFPPCHLDVTSPHRDAFPPNSQAARAGRDVCVAEGPAGRRRPPRARGLRDRRPPPREAAGRRVTGTRGLPRGPGAGIALPPIGSSPAACTSQPLPFPAPRTQAYACCWGAAGGWTPPRIIQKGPAGDREAAPAASIASCEAQQAADTPPALWDWPGTTHSPGSTGVSQASR